MKINVKHKNLNLNSKIIGPLPIINNFIDRLSLEALLRRYVPSKSNMAISHSDAILLFVRNILIERQPLYNLSEWTSVYDSEWIGLKDFKANLLNDDRVGRSLDALFEADRATLLTEIVMRTIQEFHIDLSQLHNDSTSVTVYGQYKRPPHYHGRPAILLTYGHNKDYRPDLKQLVFSLTVSRDGAVPIHYKAYDGNITDDKTHIYIWESLRRITKRSDFIYVADCKLCTREQMDYINKEGGRFITVLPETRSEQKWFRKWTEKNRIPWQEIYRTPNHRLPNSEEEFIYYGFESPLPSKESYRIIWILSSQKQEDDQEKRQRKLKKTIETLDELKSKVGKRKLKTKEQITKAVSAVLEMYDSQRWFSWYPISEEIPEYKQKKRGRPGKDTPYIQVVKKRWSFVAMPNEDQIQKDSMFDGIFPLITNVPAKKLSMKEVISKYKYQPFVEKRHEQFKSVFDAMPVSLKAPHRVEALMSVYYLVLLLNALIERELRLAMEKEKIPSLPLYPEQRLCKRPTTERVLSLFGNQRRHILKSKKDTLRIFHDPLSDLHKEVLSLLGVSLVPYQN